jgi:hypothetical protein
VRRAFWIHDDYAYFPRSQEKLEESAKLHAEARQIRVDRIRTIFSLENQRMKPGEGKGGM